MSPPGLVCGRCEGKGHSQDVCPTPAPGSTDNFISRRSENSAFRSERSMREPRPTTQPVVGARALVPLFPGSTENHHCAHGNAEIAGLRNQNPYEQTTAHPVESNRMPHHESNEYIDLPSHSPDDCDPGYTTTEWTSELEQDPVVEEDCKDNCERVPEIPFCGGLKMCSVSTRDTMRCNRPDDPKMEMVPVLIAQVMPAARPRISQTVTAVLDTGACVSAVTPSLADSLGVTEVWENGPTVELADG